MDLLSIDELKKLEWRPLVINGIHKANWQISENGILYNEKSREFKYGHDNVIGKDRHQRISIDGVMYYIARLVAEAFVPNENPKEYTIVRHLNDDPLNNHYTNLKWGTYRQNTLDGIRNHKIVYDENRKYTRLEDHPQALLTNDDVIEIAELLKKKVPITDIAEQYGVARGVIWHIYAGSSWSRLTKEYLPFPHQAVYNPPSHEIKDKIYRYLSYHPTAKPAEIMEILGLESTNSIKSYIGQTKRKILSK